MKAKRAFKLATEARPRLIQKQKDDIDSKIMAAASQGLFQIEAEDLSDEVIEYLNEQDYYVDTLWSSKKCLIQWDGEFNG